MLANLWPTPSPTLKHAQIIIYTINFSAVCYTQISTEMYSTNALITNSSSHNNHVRQRDCINCDELLVEEDRISY